MAGAKAYQVQYRVHGGKWQTTTVESKKATLKGLKAGKRYDVRVRAVSGKQRGAWSNVSFKKLIAQAKAQKTQGGSLMAASI